MLLPPTTTDNIYVYQAHYDKKSDSPKGPIRTAPVIISSLFHNHKAFTSDSNHFLLLPRSPPSPASNTSLRSSSFSRVFRSHLSPCQLIPIWIFLSPNPVFN
uniref:Uncharacterized protein n=1 Tax=Kalanchoe fedtschenkoi TaxID=63787 RepID=A0A7N0ZR69_KALFE